MATKPKNTKPEPKPATQPVEAGVAGIRSKAKEKEKAGK